MDLSADFGALQTAVTEELVAATRTSSRIGTQDIAFFRSSDPSAAESIDEKSARLLELTQKILNRANTSKSSKSIRLPEIDAIDAQWRRIVDAADSLYEHADTCLDELSGLIRKHVDDSMENQITAGNQSKPRAFNNYRDASIAKPQLQFAIKTSNHERPPFRPLLTAKPHARVQLEASLACDLTGDGIFQYRHPYLAELLAYEWPSQVFDKSQPRPYRPFETTAPIMVDSIDALHDMLVELKLADVIAVDLEHHDAHSYHGMVSLMQISTYDQDWIVDTLKPWRAELNILNEVFADPSIVKVFHGAHMDVIWLQRDFGLYLVGLFDTYHASRILHYAGASLAFLLKKFVDFDAQKQYQTADWRIRPLPRELLDYARSDTHFLIYIYECVRNELLDISPLVTPTIDTAKLDDLLVRSRNTALQRYEYPMHTDDITSLRNQWAALIVRHFSQMSSEQVAVFAKVHRWRDFIARQEDEGVHTILPNHAIFSLARTNSLDSKAALFASLTNVSPIVRQRANELISVIQEAKAAGRSGPNAITIFQKFPVHQRQGFQPQSNDRAVPQSQRPARGPSSTIDDGMRSILSSFWGSTPPDWPTSSVAPVQLYDIIHDVRSPADLAWMSLGPDSGHTNVESVCTADSPTRSAKKRRLEQRTEAEAFCAIEDSTAGALQALEKQANRRQKESSKKAAQQEKIADIPHAPPGSFDYESAPPVLHAPQAVQASHVPSKAIDPYAKAEKAATGLKKTADYHGGRTHTYR